jgi:hypothetical protein
MTNKITKEVLFTELSIKLAILEAKLDKLLELAMKPQWTALDHERGPARVRPTPKNWPQQYDPEFDYSEGEN